MQGDPASHGIPRGPRVIEREQFHIAVRGGERRLKFTTARRLGRQDPDQVRELAAGVAHNLNSLLTSIMCGSELALDQLVDDHAARAAVELSCRASKQAADLVRGLMAYAGISLSVAAAVNLSALVARAVASLHESIPRRVRLLVDLDNSLPTMQADSRALEQLVDALLANAVEAIGDRTGTVSIRTSAAVVNSEDCIRLEVSDTGCGMDEWVMGQIFEPFFSTKRLGRGLGLAAAAGIVRAHRGTVKVESTLHTGSTFAVYFPVCSPDDPPEEAEAA